MDKVGYYSAGRVVCVSWTRSTLSHQSLVWNLFLRARGRLHWKHHAPATSISRYDSPRDPSLVEQACCAGCEDHYFTSWGLGWTPAVLVHGCSVPSFPALSISQLADAKSKACLYMGLTKYIHVVDYSLLASFTRRQLVFLKPKAILYPVIKWIHPALWHSCLTNIILASKRRIYW